MLRLICWFDFDLAVVINAVPSVPPAKKILTEEFSINGVLIQTERFCSQLSFWRKKISTQFWIKMEHFILTCLFRITLYLLVVVLTLSLSYQNILIRLCAGFWITNVFLKFPFQKSCNCLSGLATKFSVKMLDLPTGNPVFQPAPVVLLLFVVWFYVSNNSFGRRGFKRL